jgi:hypothetical protein
MLLCPSHPDTVPATGHPGAWPRSRPSGAPVPKRQCCLPRQLLGRRPPSPRHKAAQLAERFGIDIGDNAFWTASLGVNRGIDDFCTAVDEI